MYESLHSNYIIKSSLNSRRNKCVTGYVSNGLDNMQLTVVPGYFKNKFAISG